MAELTIQIPDDLAQQLQPLQARLPELLAQLVAANSSGSASTALLLALVDPTQTPPAYTEVLDFLITRPTPAEITRFKISEPSQARLRQLLDKHRDSRLNRSETAELDLYEQLDQLMTMLKSRAYASIQP
jgi:hypothetical protein